SSPSAITSPEAFTSHRNWEWTRSAFPPATSVGARRRGNIFQGPKRCSSPTIGDPRGVGTLMIPSTMRGAQMTPKTPTRVAASRGKKPAQGKTPAKLLVAMPGKASAAKAAEGDEPVFAYIASLPQPQRAIAEGIDALAAKTLPNLQRAVKWGMAYYGV